MHIFISLFLESYTRSSQKLSHTNEKKHTRSVGRMNNTLIVMCTMIISCCKILAISETSLRVGFYDETCPDAESIVNGFVKDAARFDNQMPAILLRLHFHDCFVQVLSLIFFFKSTQLSWFHLVLINNAWFEFDQGCDGSILIDDDPISEKLAEGHQGVKGFDVIENAKSRLEFVCPGVVSCADIVAIAARDAVAFTFGPFYEVETGRRDGFVSNVSLADNMPDFRDSIQLLKQKFFDKGLNEKDLVVLSGAHTIGTTACFFLMDRLYNFVSGGGPDPSIDPDLLPELMETCPPNGDTDFRLPIDHNSRDTFDDLILDNIRSGFAVLQSDAKLMDDRVTKQILDSYFGSSNQSVQPSFETDFVNSMIKMGRIGVKTSSKTGEIRRVCNTFND
ncbi:heme peroxidase [Artemisia annua]|uniref:Peroxidase n=1 Tax=Artemisia annua TaxID=35608 RepID=A0A2U1MWH3_ARTAN|nr:heme peroxidase [Artemisia annua]